MSPKAPLLSDANPEASSIPGPPASEARKSCVPVCSLNPESGCRVILLENFVLGSPALRHDSNRDYCQPCWGFLAQGAGASWT